MRLQRAVRLQEPSYALPMVGRRAELAALDQAIDKVLAGQGQVWITGASQSLTASQIWPVRGKTRFEGKNDRSKSPQRR